MALLTALALVVLDGPVAGLLHHPGWLEIAPETYDALLAAVAGAAGIFLGLYFTALSTVSAAVYVTVPHDIRALIVRDRVGNLYVSGVAFTIALAVLFLVLHAVTSRTLLLATPLIGCLAAFSIFAFVQLGQRAFYLADPTRLASTLAQEFLQWLTRASADGWRWRDPAFQAHFHTRAQSAVGSLVTLLRIARRESHLREASLQNLVGVSISLLGADVGRRDRIPSDSKWFGRRYRHKQWYLTDSTEVDTATETETALMPEEIADRAWVERALMPELIAVLEADLRSGNIEGAHALLTQLGALWTRLGSRWAIDDSRRWLHELMPVVVSGLAASAQRPRAASTDGPGIWDAVAMLPLACELGFQRAFADEPFSDELERALREEWSDPTFPYSIDARRPLVEILEQTHASVAFERAVAAAADCQTPPWYVEELLRHRWEHVFADATGQLVEELTSWYPKTARTLVESGAHSSAGAILARGHESMWKLERHLREWESLVEADRPERYLLELDRPEWRWTRLRQSVADSKRQLLLLSAGSLKAYVAEDKFDPDVPDYFGETLNRLGGACVKALEANNPGEFGELFRPFFWGTLAMVERIRSSVRNWRTQSAVAALSEPIVDLLDLSGLALVYSEMHEDPGLFEPVSENWNASIQAEHGKDWLEQVGAMNNFNANLFAITHRATVRTRWEMSLSRRLEELPREPARDWYREGSVRHSSALIRAIAPAHGLGLVSLHLADLFIEHFLGQHAEAEGVDFGVRESLLPRIDEVDDEDPADDE